MVSPTRESPQPGGVTEHGEQDPGTDYESADGTGSDAVPEHSAASWQSAGAEAEGEAFTFDRAATSRHAYLGDNLEDLESSHCPLVDGTTFRVPLFPLEGVVLCPGDTLPLKLQHPSDQALVQRAVQAPPPLRGLVAVASLQRGWWSRQPIPRMGCLAEIKQLRLQEDGSLSLLCKGRQRALFPPEASLQDLVDVRVVGDPPPPRVPREVGLLAAWWPPWAYTPFDAHKLAQIARQQLALIAPKAPGFHGDPLALSYWLVSNLPLNDAVRQQLLEAATAADRLRLAVHLLRDMGKVRCRRCMAQVGDLRNVVVMSEEGVSGCFVNPHGVVHDIFMLGKVGGVALEGVPQTESSWFPGYAWTIAYCRACWHHLGWRFTAVTSALRPATFWGLRRSAIQGTALDHSGEDAEEWEGEREPSESSDAEPDMME